MSYNRPGALTKLSNSLFARLASIGLGPSKMVMLELRGRRSGRARASAVNTVEVGGRRYMVSTRGESEWVRNARAANGDAAIIRRGRHSVRLEELPLDQRAPIIQAYLKENASVTKGFFGIEPDAPLEEFKRIAPDHPVFRIVKRSD